MEKQLAEAIKGDNKQERERERERESIWQQPSTYLWLGGGLIIGLVVILLIKIYMLNKGKKK
jgi:hypothetical protein